jgi:hypothetical protein
MNRQTFRVVVRVETLSEDNVSETELRKTLNRLLSYEGYIGAIDTAKVCDIEEYSQEDSY